MASDIRRTAPTGRSSFGDRLRALRLSRGMNMPAMARALGVAKSSVTNWETGVSYPGQALIPQICDLLETTPNALYGFDEAEDRLPEDERRALRLYRRLSPGDRRNVDSLMACMRKNEQQLRREECRRGWRVLPRLLDKVCAGTGLELTADGACETLFVPDCPETREADAVVTVSGHSMEPLYADGDDLLIRYTGELRPGEIGIFTVDGEGTVKEYRPDGLYPRNPAYPVIPAASSADMRCVGRVLGVVTRSMAPDRRHRAVLQELLSCGELR